MTDENENKNQRAGNGGIIPPVEYRFKKGQTSNPNGRPPGIVDIRTKKKLWLLFGKMVYKSPDGELMFHCEGELDGQPVTNEQMVVMKGMIDAIHGDKDARRDYLNSVYGKDPDMTITDPTEIAKFTDEFISDQDAARAYEERLKG